MRNVLYVVLDVEGSKPKGKDAKSSRPTSRIGYVHIDVMQIGQSDVPGEIKNNIRAPGSPYRELAQTPRVMPRIRDFMLKCGAQDPRHKTHNYELWKVNENFSLQDFEEMVRRLPTKRDVRIVCIFDNESHEYIFRTQLLKDDVNQYTCMHARSANGRHSVSAFYAMP